MADTKISDLPAVTDLIGTDEYVLARAGATKKIDASDLASEILALGTSVGTQLDYVEITTDTTVSATTEAGAGTVISSTSLVYDGSTRICIEVFFAAVQPGSSASGADCIINLWDGGTDLKRIAQVTSGPTESMRTPVLLRRFLTPSAASHQFHVKAWRTNANATILAASASYLPGYIRITVA